MNDILALLIPSFIETLYMIGVSAFFTILLGLPLGIILVITEKNHIMPLLKLNKFLSTIINIIRSLPAIILIILIGPFARFIVGTSIGTTAAIVPLVVAATPFFARIVETSLREIDSGIVEASISMGATPLQIIIKVLLPEAMSSIVLGITITLINILGYSAIAGIVGGGGLGDLAIRYGYHRFRTDVLIACVVLLIIIVQITQFLGNSLAKKLNKK
ncbi:methionine ABC transporter permease [Paramaledivibacter caminithermalis]|jgi:D-methionine transport system permease protein|uniref:D-methionine transport system permease protein n=1 Tax=Paramaledivibacter caminithermalis (strain DSM 15212 / CIP 107654 / DViRD3) TaxID=1121301 RepID=A0A1M6LRY3_PARC5|nr:methionine ABC transporter permease [Paramaledivibacter caminithermalis]SHJ74038.1 D-methionine transport system permease protein [Paramaledivibacter caminithermalis DSM 15212]